jgi:hypothetical protein
MPETTLPPLDRAIAQAEVINPGSSPYQPGAKEALMEIKSLVVTEERLATLERRDLSDSVVQAIAKNDEQRAIATLEREQNNIKYRYSNTGQPSVDGAANENVSNTLAALSKAEASVKALDGNLDPRALQQAVQDIDVAAQNYKFVATGDLVIASERAMHTGNGAAIGAAYDFVSQGQPGPAAENLYRDLRYDLGCDQQRAALAKDFNIAIDRIVGVSKSGITGGEAVSSDQPTSGGCPIANICSPAKSR